jgi:hypothetical protein
VKQERDLDKKLPKGGGPDAAAYLIGFTDEEVDAHGVLTECQRSRVLGVIADPVVLGKPDPPASELDEVTARRVLASDRRAMVGQLVLRIRRAAAFVPPATDMWLEQPAPDEHVPDGS